MRNVAEGIFVVAAALLVLLYVVAAADVAHRPVLVLWSFLFGLAHILIGLALLIECVVLLRWGLRWVVRMAR